MYDAVVVCILDTKLCTILYYLLFLKNSLHISGLSHDFVSGDQELAG